VRKPDGEGHAVLTVRTMDGDYILDNLDDRVRLWTETPYRFMKRQAEYNTGRWVKIENSQDVLVGAVEK
jgi:predicted transglutaminase-like cysteine proteinase